MTNASCFTRNELRDYLLGELAEDASENIAIHVESCGDCEATISELDRASDTFVESLREPAPQQEQVSAYRLAAQRAKSYWRHSARATPVDNTESGNETRLRDYELLEPLARGGMGTVYRARHVRLNREVALKVLPGRWLRDPNVVARFEREMQAVGSLRHPAIVQATDGGEANGVHFLAMELIDGFDGGALVQFAEPLPIADACEIARQAAAGMAYVHEQGIVHRDLKPSNVMVTKAGEVKVLDLGLARAIGAQLAEDELTTVGQLMGTVDFMAPEQLEDSHDVNERADIYALGATLYKLLTGDSPHAATPREPMISKLRRIAAEPPLPVQDRRDGLPADLCSLVNKMLSHDMNDRPTSMEEVASLLEPFVESSDLAQQVRVATKARRRSEQLGINANTSAAVNQSVLTGLKPVAGDSKSGAANAAKWWTWIAAALLIIATAFGAVITLNTNAGQLVIETSSPNIEVRVLKAGQPHRQLTVTKQAQSLRLGAGEYEIEIIGEADGLEIENGRYTLKRGDTWLAKIVHRASAPGSEDIRAEHVNKNADLPPIVTPTKSRPTYEGKTLDQWIALLETERSPKQFYEACRALEKLATGDDTERSITAVLAAVKFHDRGAYYQAQNDAHRLWEVAQQLFAGRDQTVVLAALSRQLDNNSETHAELTLEYLSAASDHVRPAVTDRLITQIEAIANDSKSNHREDALSILQLLASEEVAIRRLVTTLSDRDIDLQLFAAQELMKKRSNMPLVVSVLRGLTRSGKLSHRAEAAWLLGDLRKEAAPAIPDLAALVTDDDPVVSRAAAYQTSYYTFDRNRNRWFISVKDAAVRALADIGDQSVLPTLVDEWELRARNEDRLDNARRNQSLPSEHSVSNTYRSTWVAEAIERLSGRRPSLNKDRQYGTRTIWYIDGTNLEKAYQTAFTNSSSRTLPDALKAAKQLMATANDSEKLEARAYIMNTNRLPTLIELDFEIQLAELLASSDDPISVLQAVMRRWFFYAENGRSFWTPAGYDNAFKSCHDCALRIARQIDNWQSDGFPLFVKMIKDRNWPACLIVVDMIEKLEEEEQVAAIVTTLQYVARYGATKFTQTIPQIEIWLSEKEQRQAIHTRLESLRGEDWVHLAVGIIRAGLADEVTLQIVRTRFADDSINRGNLFIYLIGALDDQPTIVNLAIELLNDPSLDATGTLDEQPVDVSLRAYGFLPLLERIHPSQRSNFLPLLQELAESGKNHEDKAALDILKKWK